MHARWGVIQVRSTNVLRWDIFDPGHACYEPADTPDTLVTYAREARRARTVCSRGGEVGLERRREGRSLAARRAGRRLDEDGLAGRVRQGGGVAGAERPRSKILPFWDIWTVRTLLLRRWDISDRVGHSCYRLSGHPPAHPVTVGRT